MGTTRERTLRAVVSESLPAAPGSFEGVRQAWQKPDGVARARASSVARVFFPGQRPCSGCKVASQ
eukprot:2513311-Pyramimonas_sp.AAC.1